MSQNKRTTVMKYLVKYKILLMIIAFGLWVVAAVMSSKAHAADNLVGNITKQQLFDGYPHFVSNYDDYLLSSDEAKAVEQLPSEISLKVFFGTWCHDSEREVPRLLKSFKRTNVSIDMISLDLNKSEPQGRAKEANIKYTPTFIVYHENVEIGRIIERPEVSLSEDILAMYKDSKAQK
ncbi:thioredoxin family protein [Thalassomonas sp. M1454]|uniref:thioredoxin family protein n=1 Tax=Thalassomonas sp. M1454 TaxID=2594477 RepID=UPI00163D780D|nr:thioredoxin family protein [Thalassomonas sp. M1454]